MGEIITEVYDGQQIKCCGEPGAREWEKNPAKDPGKLPQAGTPRFPSKPDLAHEPALIVIEALSLRRHDSRSLTPEGIGWLRNLIDGRGQNRQESANEGGNRHGSEPPTFPGASKPDEGTDPLPTAGFFRDHFRIGSGGDSGNNPRQTQNPEAKKP